MYISEKIVSLCQGDIIPKESVKLSPHGENSSPNSPAPTTPPGLASTMCTRCRWPFCSAAKPKVIFAAIAAGVARLFGKRGVFLRDYRPPGGGLGWLLLHLLRGLQKLRHPFSPKDPDKAAARVESETGVHCCVADINDFGGEVLAVSPKSPMGQGAAAKAPEGQPGGQRPRDDAFRAAAGKNNLKRLKIHTLPRKFNPHNPVVQHRGVMEYGKERKITLGPLPRLRRENPNQSVWGHRPDQFSPLRAGHQCPQRPPVLFLNENGGHRQFQP